MRHGSLEQFAQRALPGNLEPIRPYQPFDGLPGYDPNMRRALLHRDRTLSLLFVVPDPSTSSGALPSRWRLAPFGPSYAVKLNALLLGVWQTYAAQRERYLTVQHGDALDLEACLVSDAEAHHLVLLLTPFQPRDDRRATHSR